MRLVIALACVVALPACGSSSNDPRQMAHDLALDSITCAAPADCCAVFDNCKGQALLVGAADKAAVQVLLGQAAQTSCVRCLAPAVQVDCRQNKCVMLELVSDGTATTSPLDATVDHCGTVIVPTGWSEKPASVGVGSGLEPETILGCQ